MTSTTGESGVNACVDSVKAEIISLYQQGNGTKRICKCLGWSIKRSGIIRNRLRTWGVHEDGRDKGGGWNKGDGLGEAYALIISGYKQEQRACEKVDDLWANEWRAEQARRKAVAHYWANRDAKLEYAKTKDARKALDPAWRERRAQWCKDWKSRNKERVAELQRDWMERNQPKMKEYRRRLRKNPQYRAASNLRKRVRDLLRTKAERYSSLLGCSASFLHTYLESQFKKGMSWENYGTAWHIDHIEPCARFDLTNKEHRKRCFHYTNLQPLWVQDNLIKSDRILNPIQPSLPLWVG